MWFATTSCCAGELWCLIRQIAYLQLMFSTSLLKEYLFILFWKNKVHQFQVEFSWISTFEK
jgi:hypothetical protein